MKRIYSILLYPITVSAACAIGLDDVYTNTDVYADLVGDTLVSSVYDARKKPGSGGGSGDEVGSGDVVTSPGIQLGMPDNNFIYVEKMQTSGLGDSPESAGVLKQLQESLDADADKNALMHWYVTAGTKDVTCSPNSFRCTYDKHLGTSVVLAVWLPQKASSITLNFSTYSRGLSFSIWTYDCFDDKSSMKSHYATNNDNALNNNRGPIESISFSKTIESKEGIFDGNYLLVMFNTANNEKDFIDINGMGISYHVDGISDDIYNPLVINEFQEGVGYNLAAYDGDYPIVPEPATATLSLLALAGLAARRRRK